ncbi:MAG TPA: PAAR-like domain-containing protein, partial [Polyangia bacterium]
MPVTVGVNNMSVVHAGSNGTTIAFPDVCKTPAPPAPPIPIPYPNIAKSSDTAQGAKTVK